MGVDGRPSMGVDGRPSSGAGGYGDGSLFGATAVPLTTGPAAPPGTEPRSRGAESGGAVYRSRRSGVVWALVGLTVLFELPALRAFVSSALANRMVVGDTVTSILLIMALPMFAMGLYGLATGAAATPGQGARVWLRTPLAYLPVALVLIVAAALAAH
jgi:hypothetical protein